MMRKSPLLVIFFLALASLGNWGCSGNSISESDPAALFKGAEEDISNDRYQLASDRLRIIKNKFPYSHFAVDAQLRLADVYFLQESWAEAAATYESFRELHPKHPKVAYAMFRTGKSYLGDAPENVARDLGPATKALSAYNDFLNHFPNAPEAEEARKDVVELRDRLSKKELYIANFYYKRDFYGSAKPRFEKVIALYPETESAKEAKERLSKIEEQEKKSDATK